MTRQQENELRQRKEDLTAEFKDVSAIVLASEKENRRPFLERRVQINAEILEIRTKLRELIS